MAREFELHGWLDPSAASAADEREEAAVRRLGEIPAEQREIIVLKIGQGHTFEEIGELPGISPNTASARYRYGLQKLRGFLNGENYEDSGGGAAVIPQD